uniref:Putative secreted protein n=1 Tax=Amblyomma parvum TaxID=251391 RepID=A0A023G0D4_AMBPA
MKTALLCFCILSVLIVSAKSQPQPLPPGVKWPNRRRPGRRTTPPSTPASQRKPYCPRKCAPQSKVGHHCASDCVCVDPPPGVDPYPLDCIWSPASALRRYNRYQSTSQ